MATSSSTNAGDSRHRQTAIHHALMLEEKKKLKSRILDLILEAYDLPRDPVSSPAQATSSDIQIFKTGLALFQPSDFDDLVRERNIDDRCGYALCPKPNQKVPGGGNKVWNKKGGQDFRIVDRAELQKWCSRECGERGAFVRAQLSTEPAWLREDQNENVSLLDEMRQTDDLAEALQELAITGAATDELNAKLKALSLERGDSEPAKLDSIAIVERDSGVAPSGMFDSANEESIEGHKPR